MDDSSFRNLLNVFNLSWEGYRKVRKGVKKRVSRHMHELSCPNMASYLEMLRTHPPAKFQCELLLTVSISRFFRDTHLWESIEKEMLPDLFNRNADRIKVWSACCANGEEVYSFKIAWDRATVHFKNIPKVEILATDINPEGLERAKTGFYTKSSLKELPDNSINQYFNINKEGKKFGNLH